MLTKFVFEFNQLFYLMTMKLGIKNLSFTFKKYIFRK